jgi:hypothetical protein
MVCHDGPSKKFRLMRICGLDNTRGEISLARRPNLFPRGDSKRTVRIETSLHQFLHQFLGMDRRCRQARPSSPPEKLAGNRARTGLNDKRCEVDKSVTGVT